MAEPIKKTIIFSGKVIDQDEFIRRAQEKAVAWMDYQGLQGAERQSFLANFNNKIRSIATGQEGDNDTEIVPVETNKVRNGFDPTASVDTYLNGIAGAMPESKTDEEKPALLPYNANTMGKYIQDSIFGEGHEVSEAQLNAWADAHDPYTKGQNRSTAARNQFINQQLLAYRDDILDGKYDMSEEEKKKEIANIDKLTSIDTKDWEKTRIAPWLSNLLFTTEKYGVEPTEEATVPAESSTPVVEEATGELPPVETKKSEQKQKQKQKQNPEEESPVAFTTNKGADWARVGSFITDLISLGGGWFDLASIGSLGLDLYADIASGESAGTTIKNALINTVGGAAALIPGLASAKFIKYGKYINGILAGINAMGIIVNDDARKAIVKLCKGESITSDDLTALTNLGRQATGLTGSVRNMRGAAKNAKYKPKEHVKVETTSGRKVYVSKKHAAEMNKVGNGKNGKAEADKYLRDHAVDNKGNKVELDTDEGLKNSPFNETNGVIHRTAAKTPLVKNFVANKVNGKSVSFHTQSQLDDIATLRRVRALHREKHPVSDFLFNRAGFAVGENNPGVYFDMYTKDVDIPSGKPKANSTSEVETSSKPDVETSPNGEKPATELKVDEEGKLTETPKTESKDAKEVIEETVKNQGSEKFNPTRSEAKTKVPSPGSPEATNIIDAIDNNRLSIIRSYIKHHTKIKIKHKNFKSNQNLKRAIADLKKANHSSEEIMAMLTNKQFVERLRETYKFKQGGLISFLGRGGRPEEAKTTSTAEAKTTSTASSNNDEIIETTGDLLDETVTGTIEGDHDIIDVVDSNPNGKRNLQKPTIGNKSDFLLTGLELGKYLDSRINNYAIKNLYKKLLPVHKIFPQAEYRIWSPKQNLDFAQLMQNKSNNLGALQAKGTADQGQAFASQWLGWKKGMEQALPYYKQYNTDLKDSVDTAIGINNDNTEKRVDVANNNRAADVAKHNQDILADIQYKHDNATKFQQLASVMQNGIAKGAQAKYENDYRSYLTTDKDIIAAKESYQLALDRYNADPTTENSNALTAATSRYNSITSQKSNAWLAAHRSSLGYPFAPAIYTSPILQGFDFGSGFNFKDGGVLQEKGRMKRHYDKLFYRAQRLLLTESNKKQKAMGNGYAYFQKIMMQGKP